MVQMWGSSWYWACYYLFKQHHFGKQAYSSFPTSESQEEKKKERAIGKWSSTEPWSLSWERLCSDESKIHSLFSRRGGFSPGNNDDKTQTQRHKNHPNTRRRWLWSRLDTLTILIIISSTRWINPDVSTFIRHKNSNILEERDNLNSKTQVHPSKVRLVVDLWPLTSVGTRWMSLCTSTADHPSTENRKVSYLLALLSSIF